MRQEKREQVIKSFTAPNKEAVAGSKADKRSPMVMLLSLKVRRSLESNPEVDYLQADLIVRQLRVGWCSRFELDGG
jgi:hypothetical protein